MKIHKLDISSASSQLGFKEQCEGLSALRNIVHGHDAVFLSTAKTPDSMIVIELTWWECFRWIERWVAIAKVRFDDPVVMPGHEKAKDYVHCEVTDLSKKVGFLTRHLMALAQGAKRVGKALSFKSSNSTKSVELRSLEEIVGFFALGIGALKVFAESSDPLPTDVGQTVETEAFKIRDKTLAVLPLLEETPGPSPHRRWPI